MHTPSQRVGFSCRLATLLKNAWVRAAAWLRRRQRHATDPRVLFPAIAVLVLAVIWGTTFNLIRVERASAKRAAAASTAALAETYEAQVVRALREIDQTLKLVQYADELHATPAVLRALTARALLPPELLFVVSIADRHGAIVASTRPSELSSVADRDYFQSQLQTDSFSVSSPRRSVRSGLWTLQFSRRLVAPDGAFAGVVVVSVDADYFVSGYEPSNMGQHGVLAILGADGVFRARRTGDTVTAGDKVDYAAMVPAADQADRDATLSTNPWDAMRRYTVARQLYEFPLAVIVGLSADERMAGTRQAMRTNLWRASLASLGLILVVAVLGRMSWQLARSREQAVEEHRAHAARVEHLAYHDGLTTLPNRSLFSKLLGQSIALASRHDRGLALLFFDLDHFKHVNDTLGHEAGDQLLQAVAARVTGCLRNSDTVARLGGDEFVALLPELTQEAYVATVAQKILTALSQPFVLLGQDFRVTASIGISIYPQDGLDEETLTRNADVAMYQAKQNGRNSFQFYAKELNASSLERLALESSLRRALERSEFRLHYQAKWDVRTNRITGVEALLRWQHPDLGTLAPMRFLPIAEETGLVLLIGSWVLRTACLQSVAWQAQGLPNLVMAVNLTTRQFSDDALLSDLATVLSDTGMHAHLLELEISERLLMPASAQTLRILAGLKAMGIRIAIDDFGSGYVSLSTLAQFPLDSIKIDRSFIRCIANVDDADVAGAIITMGKTLGLTVVAQGVETKQQVDLLRQNACDEVQGFYLDKPVPADQMVDLLREANLADGDPHTASPFQPALR